MREGITCVFEYKHTHTHAHTNTHTHTQQHTHTHTVHPHKHTQVWTRERKAVYPREARAAQRSPPAVVSDGIPCPSYCSPHLSGDLPRVWKSGMTTRVRERKLDLLPSAVRRQDWPILADGCPGGGKQKDLRTGGWKRSEKAETLPESGFRRSRLANL
jgi:hypothetical protein